MARVIGVSAILRFNSRQAVGSMRRASRGFGQMTRSATKAKAAMSGLNAAVRISALAGVAATAGIGLSIKAFANFDAAAQALKSRLEKTDPPLKVFTQRALDLGKRTKFTATEILGAIEGMKKFGISGPDALKKIGTVARFATNEQLGLARSAEIMFSATSALGKPASEATKVLDLMAFVAGNTAATVPRLVEGLKLVGPIAKVAGVDARQLVATLGLLNSSALFGSRAGTALASALTKVAKAQKGGIVQLTDQLRFRVEKLKDGSVDLTQTMLNAATGIKVLKDAGKAADATKAAIELFGARGARAFGKFLDAVKGKDARVLKKLFKAPQTDIEGFNKRIFQIREKNVKDDFVKLTSAINTLGVSMVRNFKGQIGGTIRSFTKTIGNAAIVFDFVTKSAANMGKTIPQVLHAVQRAGKGNAISPATVALVLGAVRGFKDLVAIGRTTIATLRSIGSAFVFVADSIGVTPANLTRIAIILPALAIGIKAVVTGVAVLTGGLGLAKLAMGGFAAIATPFFAITGIALGALVVQVAIITAGFWGWYKALSAISRFGGWKILFRDISDTIRGKKATGNISKKFNVKERAAESAIQNLVTVSRTSKTIAGPGGKRQTITRDLARQKAREALSKKGVTGIDQQNAIINKFNNLIDKLAEPGAKQRRDLDDFREERRNNRPVIVVEVDGKVLTSAVAGVQSDIKSKGGIQGRRGKLLGGPAQ